MIRKSSITLYHHPPDPPDPPDMTNIQGRAGAEFLTGHISVVGAQMKYEDEQSESTIDAVGRCWATTLRKQQRGPSWNPCMVYARHHFKSFFTCAIMVKFLFAIFISTMVEEETTYFGTFHLHHGWRNFIIWHSQMPSERPIFVIFILTMVEDVLRFHTHRILTNE